MTEHTPITVVKLGGTEGVDFSAICSDAAELLKQGKQLVFVHGGSAEANSLGELLGTPPRMITSPSGYTSRYTKLISRTPFTKGRGVKVVPSGISLQGFQQADPDKLRDVMHKLVDRCEFLLIDAPSGISKEGVVPLSVADQVILVVNPELASMADALKTKILCEVMGGSVYGAILNRAGQEHTELRSQSVEDVLGVRVIDVVPEDGSVRRAAAYKTPCVLKYPGTDASRAFKRIAAQMSGVEYEEEAGEPKHEGFVDRLARAVFR